MENISVSESLKNISSLIESNRLSDAFAGLIPILQNLKRFKYLEIINQLQSSYKYMLEYALTGGEDKGRELHYSDIKETLRGFVNEISVDVENEANTDYFYANRRLYRMRKETLSELFEKLQSLSSEISLVSETGMYREELYREYEDILDRIFEKVMSLPYHSDKELKIIKKFCLNDNSPTDARLLVITALFFTAISVFDRFKILALIDLYSDSQDDKLAARLLVAIIIILNKYKVQIHNDKVICERLELWQDSLLTYTRLRDTIMNFLRTVDTTRINDKMKQDLLPGLNNIDPEILKKLSRNFNPEDLEENEFNPEWEEMLKSSGLEEKMKEFAELQSEGADIMMMPFSQLKQFPFFNKMSHWFMPFSKDFSQLSVMREMSNDFFDSMLEVAPFCDSDKYSFALSLNQMPSSQRDLMKMQMAGGMEQMKIENEERLLKQKNPKFDGEVRNFLRNLYRFYNLFRKKEEFENTLSSPINFVTLPVIGKMLNEMEIVKLAAEFFFKRGYFKDALRLFRLISEADPSEVIWDKIGFCYQSLAYWNDALESYQKAEMFGNRNLWRVRMMALCYTKLGNEQEAVACYAALHEAEPENKKFLHNLALGEMRLGNYRKAAELCYKYEYLSPGNIKILQLLSLAEIYSGDTEKGRSIAERIIFEFGIESDKINFFVLGTLHLVNGEMKESLKFYRMLSPDTNSWFEQVSKEFKSLGMWKQNEEKLRLMKEYDLLKI